MCPAPALQTCAPASCSMSWTAWGRLSFWSSKTINAFPFLSSCMVCDHLPSAQCHTCLYLLFLLCRPAARSGTEPILEQNSWSCIPRSIHWWEINVDFCTLPHCDFLIRHIFQRNNAIRGLVLQVHLKKGFANTEILYSMYLITEYRFGDFLSL